MEKIEILKKYIIGSPNYMSAYGKHHILNANFSNIEIPMNSGTFIKMNNLIKLKYYLSFIFQISIFGKVVLFNEFARKYKLICREQSRLFNYELLYHKVCNSDQNERI